MLRSLPPLDVLIPRLAYAGLLPFVTLALLIWLVKPGLHPFVAIALTSYAAAVAAFLGGIHWGVGFKLGRTAPPLHFVWGVVVPLLAWLALVMPAYAGLPLLGLLFVGCYLVDRRTWPAAGLGEWLTLRFRLSIVATLSCVLGAAGT